ncbi:UDP-3-O-(3-hydroxymyristoyl)glucosamine N-acyltransferase [Agriterribacter sp.]|uniref:UDP-3-O-(3-hydroxymyristoyl)glucosamine N-acyltransferase n=1 Tax=Agriterribacter sp. TaxID=2821509 RepID=UPI002B909525|nr:UDP-3-O-(3-hydroxymyristoyl)glucosamine N-acyltransferase [Agriterribacter sp.]HRO44946.1 UDP-3-O-(3-hydroxymyristoyl)glucosamine N-acyltransferase [Agriterribacter sp.]HRQ15684.1 UDP-3-O-(3-hydroxymyristoyl)glucosamine N-acyltransferase [Agriterribacter sp.]
MKFPSPVSVQWLAALIDAGIAGNINGSVTGINEIHRVEPGDIVFVDHPKYYDQCINSAATCIIINNITAFPEEKTLLVTENPFEAYLTIVRHFRPYTPAIKAVSDTAVIGKGTSIAPGVVIGNEVTIGNNCIIHPNVTILDHCTIGNNVIIQPGTVIGSDAFYYNSKKNREVWYKKMESCGRVVIEDDVEIGAGCTIDRGVTNDTVIGRGTKMDNMVHVGHDTIIGKNCLLAAQVGIAGGVEIGNGVTLWGQVGVSKTLTIEDNVTVLAQSGVGGLLEKGKTYFGSPADDAGIKKRELVWIKRIPEIWKKVMMVNGQ